jgi:hypothetical protein
LFEVKSEDPSRGNAPEVTDPEVIALYTKSKKNPCKIATLTGGKHLVRCPKQKRGYQDNPISNKLATHTVIKRVEDFDDGKYEVDARVCNECRVTPDSARIILNSYVVQGLGITTISKASGISREKIKKILEGHGVEIRSANCYGNWGKDNIKKKPQMSEEAKLILRSGQILCNDGRWRYEKITKSDGYVYLYLPKHPRANDKGRVSEHLVVIEEKIGRPAKHELGEQTHHKNLQKHDNRPKNLFLSKNEKQHGQWHASLNLCVADFIDHDLIPFTEEDGYTRRVSFWEWYDTVGEKQYNTWEAMAASQVKRAVPTADNRTDYKG